MHSGLVSDLRLLMQEQIYSLFKKYSEKKSITPSELSTFIYLVDSYRILGGNSSVDRLKDEVTKLIFTDIYTPNEYRLAMGMNEVINPLNVQCNVCRQFSAEDLSCLNSHYCVTAKLQNERQEIILDAQVQCDAATMERLRYETQYRNTCSISSYDFDDAARNIAESTVALYADNKPLYFKETSKKKRYTIYDLDRLIFPEDPIRDWTEKRVAEIEKKFEKWDDILETM